MKNERLNDSRDGGSTSPRRNGWTSPCTRRVEEQQVASKLELTEWSPILFTFISSLLLASSYQSILPFFLLCLLHSSENNRMMPRHSPSSKARRSSGLSQRPGLEGSVARFWQRSYAADYVGFALLITAYMFVRSLSLLRSMPTDYWVLFRFNSSSSLSTACSLSII